MGHQGALVGLGVDKLDGLAGQVVEAVDVFIGFFDEHFGAGLVHPDHGFKEVAGAVLDELADGVQVGGEIGGGGEDALLVLPFAFGVELLEPFAHHGEGGFVVHQNFGVLALAVENIAQGSILIGGVEFHGIGLAGNAGFLSALHHFFDIDAGSSDGKQTHSRQHGEAAAHIIRNHKGFIAFGIAQVLQCTPGLVGGGIDAALGTFLAILFFQHLLEKTEGDGGFGGGAGLGDNVDGEIPVADDLHDIVQVGRRNVVAGEIDFRNALFPDAVIHLALAEFDGGAGAQIGTADADHH